MRKASVITDESEPKAASRFARALERRLLRYIGERGLLVQGDRVLVGVSGGPDSTTLLLCLAHLRRALGIELGVAHFDHHLRSRQEAEADAAWVRALAESLGLPFCPGSGDVRAYARRHRQSLEEAGRVLRYRFLAQEAARWGASAIAVGHTADDQVETVLLHLLRGSGTDGLVGMRPRGPLPLAGGCPVPLVRPLLAVTRQETERYCREEGIQPRLDVTNLSLGHQRNRIRHELLPLLRRYNPSLDRALLRLADAVAEDVDYLRGVVDEVWERLGRVEGGRVRLPRRQLSGLPAALQARLLRRAGRHLLAEAGGLSSAHVRALATAAKAEGNAVLHLPHGLTAVVEGDEVALERGRAAMAMPPLPQTELNLPGETVLSGWRISIHIVDAATAALGDDPLQAWLDLEAVGRDLWVRSRRRGDRFRPLGMALEKKLQDFFVDAKVPRRQRDATPLLCAPWGIVWVVGHRIDDRAKLTAATRQALHITFKREELLDGPER
ncbi:MAG: tRNA lysidine(34) synthetase TilS [Dehalococcoidia bacterium]